MLTLPGEAYVEYFTYIMVDIYSGSANVLGSDIVVQNPS